MRIKICTKRLHSKSFAIAGIAFVAFVVVNVFPRNVGGDDYSKNGIVFQTRLTSFGWPLTLAMHSDGFLENHGLQRRVADSEWTWFGASDFLVNLLTGVFAFSVILVLAEMYFRQKSLSTPNRTLGHVL